MSNTNNCSAINYFVPLSVGKDSKSVL